MNMNQTMASAMAPLKEWFGKLAPRERLLVSVAAALAVVAVVFSLSFRPLLTAWTAAEARVAEQRSLLAEIEQLARRAGPQRATARPGSGPASGESLVVLVDRSTRERGIGPYLKRNQPEGDAAIRLRLENVPFDQLLEWMADAQARYGLSATAASFDPSGESGRVNSNLVLSRTAG